MAENGIDQHAVLQDLATLISETSGLEGLVRPLLELITHVTEYEVAYLTVHDRFNDHQLWRFVHVEAGVGPPEGRSWPWEEVLCHYVASRGRHTIADLETEVPGHPSNRLLGVRGFVSVPYSIVGRGGEVAGTLCASSSQPVEATEEVLRAFHLFAHLVADRFGREIELGHERIRADVAERTLIDRTTFLAQAEHALKSPLLIVRGWAEHLDDHFPQLDDAARRDAVRRVRAAADRLGVQVDALLAEAQATVLGHDLLAQDVELASHLAALCEEYDGAANDLDIVAGTLSGIAHVDPRALDQILGHLLENAMKYAAGGRAGVSSTATPSGVTIRVQDDGPGLEPGLDVFDPFVRGTEATTAAGAGLGMHIVRQLAEASGGAVRAGNCSEGGAWFEVDLPAAPRPLDASAAPPDDVGVAAVD